MAKITYAGSGATFEVPEGTSLLEFCQQNEVPHPFGCTVGSCGTCICVVETGAEALDAPDDDERETIEMCTDVEGTRLGCQMVVRGDMTLRPLN